MSNIDGLGGLNTSPTTNLTKLIASYGNDLVDVIAGTGYSQNITSGNNAEFETYLDNLFFQNFKDKPRHLGGDNVWRKTLATKMPMSKFMRRWRTQMYLAYTKFPQTGVESWDKDPINSGVDASKITFPSRVFFPEQPTTPGELKWGVLWSQRFTTLSDGDNKVFLSSVVDIGFKEAGIKFGDPLYILDGNSFSIGKYTIASIDSNRQVTVTTPVPKQLSNVSGWCGSNWFDVNTDDGDYLMWLEENSDRLLCFKQNSLHRYDKNTLRQIKGVPGTTAGRSVVNIKDTFTVYFYGGLGNRSGFYLYDGSTSRHFSKAIEDHVAGISSGNYGSVVAWSEGDLYRCWVGDITNTNYNLAKSKVILTLDINSQTWSVDPNPKTILCAAQIRQTNQLNTYIADDSASVYQTGLQTDFSYDTQPINFVVETWPSYPASTEVMNDFTRVQVIARNARGVKVSYKLYNTPVDVDDNWAMLGDLKDDKTEFTFPTSHRGACGIAYRFSRSSTAEPDMLIEKITTFFNPEGTQHARVH
jgi:hypothetical protein